MRERPMPSTAVPEQNGATQANHPSPTLPTSTSLLVEDGGSDLAQALPATTAIPLPTSTSLLVEDGGADLA
jgi:hypothetical protein